MRSRDGLTLVQKARLAARIWKRFVLVVVDLRREPLPALVERLASSSKFGETWRL